MAHCHSIADTFSPRNTVVTSSCSAMHVVVKSRLAISPELARAFKPPIIYLQQMKPQPGLEVACIKRSYRIHEFFLLVLVELS